MKGTNIIREAINARPIVPLVNKWGLSASYDGEHFIECTCNCVDGFIFFELSYSAGLHIDTWTKFVKSACEYGFLVGDSSITKIEVGSKLCEAAIVWHP